MRFASGFYINIYDELGKDVFILLNEPNDEPTIDENDAIQHIVERELKNGCSVERLQEAIEDSGLNCVAWGVQVFMSYSDSNTLLRG